MTELTSLLNELENNISNYDKVNVTVSKASVGWHIEHTLLTTILIIETMGKSIPQDYQWKFNLSRTFVYTINKIPRGRAKSPKSVQPKGEIVADNLTNKIAIARAKVEALSRLERNHYFVHPYFGKLNVKPAIKFLKIHTRHHLHIIKDILQS